MSRSRKKFPRTNCCIVKACGIAKAKKQLSKDFRRLFMLEDLPDGNYYKRWKYDWRWHPADGKYWSIEERHYRK